MGGLCSWQQLLGGQILKENIKKRHILYTRCPFPAPSLLYPVPFRVVVVHYLCLVALLVVGRGRVEWQVMVRDDDVAADGCPELWGGLWESELREISNNDLKLTNKVQILCIICQS